MISSSPVDPVTSSPRQKHPRVKVDGVLLVDKPAGITSADVIRRLKHRYHLEKIGHGGTLDPMATGLLVILCGKATRLQELIPNDRKHYEGTVLFGIRTDSDDRTGSVLEEDLELRSLRSKSPESIVRALKEKFSGVILQRPPAVSAVKVDGQRSYALAREGELVEHAERPAEIYSLDLHFVTPTLLRYSVICSRGTYVRSLARDFGKFLEVPATLDSIRRVGSGPFRIADALTLENLLDSSRVEVPVEPLDRLVEGMKSFSPPLDVLERLKLGNQSDLNTQEALNWGEEGERAVLRGPAGELAGILEKSAVGWGIRLIF